MDLTLIRRDALYDTSETDSRFLFFYRQKCDGGSSSCTLAHTEFTLLSLSVRSAAYSSRLSSPSSSPLTASPISSSLQEWKPQLWVGTENIGGAVAFATESDYIRGGN